MKVGKSRNFTKIDKRMTSVCPLSWTAVAKNSGHKKFNLAAQIIRVTHTSLCKCLGAEHRKYVKSIAIYDRL